MWGSWTGDMASGSSRYRGGVYRGEGAEPTRWGNLGRGHLHWQRLRLFQHLSHIDLKHFANSYGVQSQKCARRLSGGPRRGKDC